MWKIASDHAKRWWSCSRKALLAEAMVDKVMERALQVFARETCHVEISHCNLEGLCGARLVTAGRVAVSTASRAEGKWLMQD